MILCVVKRSYEPGTVLCSMMYVRMMLYPVSYILYSGTVKNSAEIVLFLFFWKTR